MNARAMAGSIIVSGGGPVALSAAVAFARAMPTARVTLLPMAVPADALADRHPLVLPSGLAMLEQLGFPPDRLRAQGMAIPRIASRYLNWSMDGQPWMVGDDIAAETPGVALHHLWLRAGRPVPFDALNPGCVAAMTGQVPTDVEPALHLDAGRMSATLAGLARQAGVRIATGTLAEVVPGPEGIAALVLADGARLNAHLYVDAAGGARMLARSGAFDDWSAVLPCTRLSIAPSDEAPRPVDTYRATADGWVAAWPGATATAWLADAPAAAIRLRPGRLAEPWHGNVLALGEAGVQPGPLGLTGFTLALAQIALAIELLPAGPGAALLRAEYNRRAGQRADRMRDFLALHYVAGGWRVAVSATDLPPSLAHILTQFARRGQVPGADEDSVLRDMWIAVLLGQGIVPERPDPIAQGIPHDAARHAVLDFAARIRASIKAVS